MRPHSSSAYLSSLLLHGFVAALIILSAYFVARQEPVPKIIELVAGPATDMNSLEAPAEGVANPVKMNIPAPKVEPQPQTQPEQTPAVQETPKPEPAKTPPVTKAKSDTSFVKQMNKSTKSSYQKFLKDHPIPKQSAVAQVREAKVQHVDTTGIAGGLKNGSTKSTGGQNGTAMTREEADQLSTYISYLIQELKRAHEPPPGVSDKLECKVTFDITASGAI